MDYYNDDDTDGDEVVFVQVVTRKDNDSNPILVKKEGKGLMNKRKGYSSSSSVATNTTNTDTNLEPMESSASIEPVAVVTQEDDYEMSHKKSKSSKLTSTNSNRIHDCDDGKKEHKAQQSRK